MIIKEYTRSFHARDPLDLYWGEHFEQLFLIRFYTIVLGVVYVCKAEPSRAEAIP